MPLAPDTRLGPYQIVSMLGAGGMGEVYRARDTRLGRDVALKILPEQLASDAARVARFEHEARAAGALNHPNIVALYDIGTDAGVLYMVTELVDGEPLRALMQHGPVSVRWTIDIATQIPDGLAAAHAANLAHRDLKPENIMVTRDGRVKILDFGLARQTSSTTTAAADVTVAVTRTEPGMVVGTVAYMSPEQVRGVPADGRSDIFSFGVIVHEMLAGWRSMRGRALKKRSPIWVPISASAPSRNSRTRSASRPMARASRLRRSATVPISGCWKASMRGSADTARTSACATIQQPRSACTSTGRSS